MDFVVPFGVHSKPQKRFKKKTPPNLNIVPFFFPVHGESAQAWTMEQTKTIHRTQLKHLENPISDLDRTITWAIAARLMVRPANTMY